jgi:hypothetical protein
MSERVISESPYARQDRYRQRNSKRVNARKKAQYAMRMGRLVPGPCEIGGECDGRIEAHHDDYAKPLEVRWVCRKHHPILDRAAGNVPWKQALLDIRCDCGCPNCGAWQSMIRDLEPKASE